MTKLKVYNQKGKEIEAIDLDKNIFDGKINKSLLYQVVLMYQANNRRGCHATKTRAYISGGGKKPWRQKGTGRARVGSIRSPLWRHGGIVFGPHPREYNFELPNKIRTKALQSSLNVRLEEDAVVILDDVDIAIKRTKEFYKILQNLKLNENCLFVIDDSGLPLLKAGRNIPYLSIKMLSNINALDVLASKKILMTKKTFLNLSNRLSKIISD